jgi:N-acyl-phosphatidylethanolamine-hydrolysing phospholipase D
MYILAAAAVITVWVYLRYFPFRYDEKKHLSEIENQRKEDFYSSKSGKRYLNLWKNDSRNILHSIKWFFEKKPYYAYEKGKFFPENRKPGKEDLEKLIAGKKDFIIWIGHSTTLIRTAGHFFLCDPVFSERLFFTKRKREPGIGAEVLNEVFGNKNLNILITHNHYDHLDIKSLKKLRINDCIYTPAGSKKLLKKVKAKEIKEMDWWESEKSCCVTVNFLPSQHYSHRITQGKNRSLWGSYLLETENGNIFIGGDSGYFGGYKEFGNKFNIKYAVLPVGGYETRWYAAYEHMNVEDSLMAINDLKCEFMIPVHWGTFHLGVEPPDYTGFRFCDIIKNNIDMKNKIKLLNFGEIFFL